MYIFLRGVINRVCGLSWLGVVLLSFVSLVSFGAHAASSGTSRAQAQAQCQAASDSANAVLQQNHSSFSWSCVDHPSTGGAGYFQPKRTDGALGSQYSYAYTEADTNPCDGMKSSTQNFVGKLLNGFRTCMANPQPDGSSVQCGVSFHAISDPVRNDWGNWGTYGTLSPTGSVCGDGPGDGGGWTDSAGGAPAQPPAPPPKTPPPDAPPPKTCGNVSCYDPSSGKYCAQGDSGQVCTSGPPPNTGGNGGAPGNGGSCGSGGDVSVCAGKPQAPSPPPDKQPDPPTATRGTDNYTHADANTGATYTTTTTTYNSGGGAVSSGASEGDSKPPASSGSSGGTTDPAPSSSSGGTGASGGGDCSNPPSVSGSPALAMVATQAWQTRCATDQVHKDLAGDGSASPGDVSTPSGQSAFVSQPSSGDATADAANTGTYDQVGMGFSTTCPMRDLQVPLWDDKSISIAFSKGCDIGVWIRALVIAFALFAAAKITVGGSN